MPPGGKRASRGRRRSTPRSPRRADIEFLYDRPYEDKSRVRVAGPFTVESLSPHRVVPRATTCSATNCAAAAHGAASSAGRGTCPRSISPPWCWTICAPPACTRSDKKPTAIHFTSLQPWPGEYIGAEGRFLRRRDRAPRRHLHRPGVRHRCPASTSTAAAREASEARFDVLIACAFNYDAHASELTQLGPLPILKARMNPDLHMADDLKNTGKGNLFVVFGEPDIDVEPVPDGQISVRRSTASTCSIPQTGDIRSGDTKGIAAWFIDTDYNEESFFVRHAYFLGANDPYKIAEDRAPRRDRRGSLAKLYPDTSRPFPRPETGRIAVKVINHFGDEVMKVFGV